MQIITRKTKRTSEAAMTSIYISIWSTKDMSTRSSSSVSVDAKVSSDKMKLSTKSGSFMILSEIFLKILCRMVKVDWLCRAFSLSESSDYFYFGMVEFYGFLVCGFSIFFASNG